MAWHSSSYPDNENCHGALGQVVLVGAILREVLMAISGTGRSTGGQPSEVVTGGLAELAERGEARETRGLGHEHNRRLVGHAVGFRTRWQHRSRSPPAH